MSRTAPILPLLALLALAPAADAAAATKKPKPLPSLLAQATTASGGKLAKRVKLDLLDPAEFRVVKRPSASSVTLGWPAAKPCAFSTFRLSILPGASDADAAAAAVVPTPFAFGSATRFGTRQIDGSFPKLIGHWRSTSTIEDSRILRTRSVAVKPLTTRYSELAGGLLQLRLDARTAGGQDRCSGPNVFQIGPRLDKTIITSA